MTHALHRRADLSESWKTVRVIEAMIQANTGGIIFSLVPNASGFARIPESLLLVFAVSVLEDALECLRDEGAFSSRKKGLSALMKASKSHIEWQNFDELERIRRRRNDVAHRREFLDAGQCKRDLAAIAKELLAWGVITADYIGKCTVAMGGSAKSDA
jgi:hypothetical protein